MLPASLVRAEVWPLVTPLLHAPAANPVLRVWKHCRDASGSPPATGFSPWTTAVWR
jgi:hypothetical protein